MAESIELEDVPTPLVARLRRSRDVHDLDLEQYRAEHSPRSARERPGSECSGPVRRSIVLSASAVAVNVDPADGRSLVWKHAVCGLLVFFNCWGINLSFGVFQEYYVNWLTPSLLQSRVVLIGSVQLALMFILAIPVGRAFDSGWCRAILIPGAVLMCVSQFLLSACQKWWELFLVQGIMMGIGMGMVFMTATLCLTTYFKNNIGIAMFIGSAGSSIGGIVYAYVARQLLRHANFRVTCLAMGGIMLGTMIPPCVVFKLFPGRASLPTKIVFWNTVKQLEPTFIIMLVGMFLTFIGLYCGFYFVST